MNYQPEIDPALAVDFPLERARLYHLCAGLGALKLARSRMPEEVPVMVPEAAVEAAVEAAAVIQMPIRTASDNLAEIREQVRREAA